MQPQNVTNPELHIIGLTQATSNKDEMNPKTAKIGPTVQQYFSQNTASKIPHRKNPGRTIAVYTEYESDHNGPYRYFIGEEVTSLDDIPEGLASVTIADGNYQRFTTEKGPLPKVVIDTWQHIWQQPSDQRRFFTDFEIYDERAADPSNAIVDIFIGVK